MVSETCNCDEVLFFHDAISAVRLQLLDEFLNLQIEFFEDPADFANYREYKDHYFVRYHVKFAKYLSALDICKAFEELHICIWCTLQHLRDRGFSELVGVKIIEKYLKEKESIDAVSWHLDNYILKATEGYYRKLLKKAD